MSSQQRKSHKETSKRDARSKGDLPSKSAPMGESENGNSLPPNARQLSHRPSRASGSSMGRSSRSSHRRSGSSDNTRLDSEEPMTSLSSHQKQSKSPKRSSRSSSRRNNSRRSTSRRSSSERVTNQPSHSRRGSADGASGSANRSSSGRNRQSKIKPRRHKSLDSDVLSEDEEKASFTDDGIKPRLFKQGSQKKGAAISTLYGKDEDAKAKAKASRESSQRAIKPGVERVSDNGTPINTLYGSDANAQDKAKASERSGERARNPGVQEVLYGSDTDGKAKASGGGYPKFSPSSSAVSTKGKGSSTQSSSAVRTLYGSDGDAKAKAYRGGSDFASNSDVETILHSNTKASINTLYGSDADAKAKAKATISGVASNPGVETVHIASMGSIGATNHNSDVRNTLYGPDSDAKAKAAGGLMFAANPGVQSIALPATLVDNEAETNVEEPVARRLSMESTNSESGSTSEPKRKSSSSFARDNIRIPNDPKSASNCVNQDMKGNDEEPKKSRKKRIGCFILSLLLIGGGIAAYFLFQNDSDNEGNQISTSFNIQDPTRAPTSMPPVAPSGGGNMTISPTSPPFLEDVLFQPPSESNCEAIAKNETIAGRDEMEEAYFGLELEVVLTENLIMTEPLVNKLLDAIQEKILPSLAGCSILVDEFVEAWRFVIFDAFVTGNVLPDETCNDEALAAQNCHLMSIQLDLFLKGQVRFLDIIGLIQAEEENITNHLGLSDPFSIVKLVTIDNMNPTSSPSFVPTDVPSSTPSDFPTVQESASPTPLPTATPTEAAYGAPTKTPSLMPASALSRVPTTSSPAMTPSFPPISVRTVNPSTLPSETPSGTPSGTPTGTPTGTPSAAPSGTPSGTPSSTSSLRPSKPPSATPSVTLSTLPTPTPTATSSMMPTALPSRPPTNVPSVSPISPAPSMDPTATRSSTPSLAPSSSPSSVPSSQLTITTFHWATCGAINGCPGALSAIENLNHVRLGGSPSGLEIGVRCCSDTLLPGFVQMFDSCPYANSKIDGECYSSVTYYEADYLCQSVGARLCTLIEAENNCARGSGCQGNVRFTWTSTPGVLP